MSLIEKEMPDFGYELEFFGVRDGNKIFNASTILSAGEYYTTKIFSERQFIADGTAFECLGRFDYCRSHNDGNFYQYAFWELRRIIDRLFGKGIFSGHNLTPLFSPVVSTEQGYEFLDVRDIYASEKEMRNAYSGKHWMVEKKDEDRKVTVRTAGFHIHIAFPKWCEKYLFLQNRKSPLADEFIKDLDKIYDEFIPQTPEEILRNEKFANKGDYRLKYFPAANGYADFTTIEYRQFSSSFILLEKKLRNIIFEKIRLLTNSYVDKLREYDKLHLAING